MKNGLSKAITQVYFNPEKPENRTIRLKSSKQQLCEIMLNGEWKIQHAKLSENKMIKRVSLHLRGSIPPKSTSSERVFGEAPSDIEDDDLYTNFSNMIKSEHELVYQRQTIRGCLKEDEKQRQQQHLTG